MGMFKFLKDKGASIFGRGKNEAEAIESLLKTDLGNTLSDLKVEFDKGVVTLSGKADSHATK